MITGELKSKVDKLWTTFWNNGISNPLSIIEQISYLLFLKRLDDLELAKERNVHPLHPTLGDRVFMPEQQHLRWSHFQHLANAEEMLRIVRDEAFPWMKTMGQGTHPTTYAQHMKDAVFLMTSPALLATVVEQIGQIPLQDRDTKGDLYEYMLSKLSTAGTNGQFRTPRHIIKMIVELMAPGTQEVICDPACGTGGFLVAAAEYVRNLKNRQGNGLLNPPENWVHLNREMFHGFDFDGTMLRISSMNLMLHGITNPLIEARDSLSEEHAAVEEAFTLILANPPFKGSIEKATIAKNLTQTVPTTKTELLFLALFLRLLKPGGRAAVIVPDGVLFGSSKAHRTIRRILVEEHRVDGIISLPAGVFKPYTGVSTAIVIFTKLGIQQGGTEQVWFYDMQADGFSLDDRRQPVAESDIADVLHRWQTRNPEQQTDRSHKAFFVSSREIAANGYDLSLNRYKQAAHEAVQYEAPQVILQRLRALEEEIQVDLDAIEKMLG
ncbi:type I restriction-modification system subunit M [Alkalinema pantanalense CENA528]|uniref:type I restriction-modification system subunit M n=1 Tax=Alkalinema pantanalense TaxID=1620705 RepID=UPI003D6F5B5B